MSDETEARRAARSPSGRASFDRRRQEVLRELHGRGVRLLHLVDVVVLLAVMVGLNLVRYGTEWPTYPLSVYLVAFAGATAVHLVVYYFGGLYEREPRLGMRPLLPRVAALTGVAVLVVATGWLLVGRYPGGRVNLAALAILATLGMTATRSAARWLRRRREGPARVLLAGAPDEVNLARAHLGEGDGLPAEVVGETNDAAGLAAEVDGNGATDVLALSGRMLDDLYPEPLTTLEHRGVGVLQRVGPRDTLLGLRGLREIAGMPFVALRTHTLPVSRARFKRVVELTELVASLPLTLPAAAMVAVYVRLVAGSPVLFAQERIGRDGERFQMLKFRTMHPEAEEDSGPVLARPDDERVLRGCVWLRSTRLDELPQLWNVARGEMSIVGPRPERPELTAHYEALIPGYFRRHQIPPGITGLAQIHGHYHTDPEYKLGHDLQYLVNWSPIRDLEILARTIWVVLSRRG